MECYSIQYNASIIGSICSCIIVTVGMITSETSLALQYNNQIVMYLVLNLSELNKLAS